MNMTKPYINTAGQACMYSAESYSNFNNHTHKDWQLLAV